MPASRRDHELPLVSTIVPAYNHAQYVGAAIDSLIAQSYPNLELIVINDGSSDSTLEILESRRSDCERRFGRFVLIDQKNSGVAAALNRGIQEARAKFVYLLSSDDLAEPDAIESLMPEMVADTNVAVACGDAHFIDANGAPLTLERDGIRYSSFVRLCLSWREDVDLANDFGSYRSLIIGNYLPVGLLLRREYVIEVGGYDPNCQVEDLDLWLKLAKTHRFKFVDRVLSRYRWHGKNTILAKTDAVIFGELLLMVRELGFCSEHGLTETWRTNIKNLLFAYCNQRDVAQQQLADQLTRLQEEVQHAQHEHDIALQQLADQAARLQEQVRRVQRERDEVASREAALIASTSWRITHPLRSFAGLLKRFVLT